MQIQDYAELDALAIAELVRRGEVTAGEVTEAAVAAIEAVKVGHGGLSYVARLFGCDPETVRHGEEDLAQLPEDEAAGRVRKKGGPQAS